MIEHPPSFVHLIVRPPHDQKARQDVDEDPLDPRRHDVRLRGTEVHIEDYDGDAYTETNQHMVIRRTISTATVCGAVIVVTKAVYEGELSRLLAMCARVELKTVRIKSFIHFNINNSSDYYNKRQEARIWYILGSLIHLGTDNQIVSI